MKKPSLSTALGIAAALFGFWWIFECLLYPLIRFLIEEKEAFDYVFTFTLLPIMAIPGIFAAYYGFQLTKEKKKENIKGTAGAFAVFGAIWLASLSSNMLGEGGLETILSLLALLIATLVAIPLYVVVSRLLMKKEGLIPTKGEFVGKGIVMIIAWEIWLAGCELVKAFAPVKQGYTHVKEEPWNLVGIIGPILIACAFYKITTKLITQNRVEQVARADGENAAAQL